MKRLTTIGLAEACKSMIGKESHYALAKLLGVSNQTIANWYKRGQVMEDATGIKVAELLNTDTETVLIWLHVERIEKRGDDKLSQHWRHIAEQIAA